MNGDSGQIAEQSPNVNQVAPCPQLVHVGPNLGKAKQYGQFTPDENLPPPAASLEEQQGSPS